jgi:hypothetical protein
MCGGIEWVTWSESPVDLITLEYFSYDFNDWFFHEVFPMMCKDDDWLEKNRGSEYVFMDICQNCFCVVT